MTTKRHFALLVPLCLLLLTGCGSKKRGDLSGTVTYDGGPVTGGTISFYPEEGPSYLCSISPDGTYSIGQLPKGEYTVVIETESINPKRKQFSSQDYGGRRGQRPPGPTKDRQPRGGGSPKPPGHEDAPAGIYRPIPKKYADKSKSDLKITVTGGSQTEEFNLVGPLEKGR